MMKEVYFSCKSTCFLTTLYDIMKMLCAGKFLCEDIMRNDRSLLDLPSDYVKDKHIDLKKDKKVKKHRFIISVVISIVIFSIGCLIVPFSWIHNDEFFLFQVSRFLVCFMIFLILPFIIAHELIHGFFFKRFSGEKANYGFTNLRFYARCKAYFYRNHYLIITLSPVILLGVLLLLLSFFLPIGWFWRIYIFQIVNFCIASGDIHTAISLRKLSSDTLIWDTGNAVTFYSKVQK